MYSRIAGTGRYLPERILTNTELERMVDTSDEWIRSRTGIERRHIAADHQATSDLAYEAALAAMEAAGIGPGDLDLIVTGSTTPDLLFPNLACLLQQRLGVHGTPAISLEAACSGFLYGLSVADKFIRAGEAKYALVIGAETLSRITDWTSRDTCVLFGDGAGAVVLEAAAEPGILATHLGADGHYKDLLYVPTGTSRRNPVPTPVDGFIHMRGNELFKVAVKTLGGVAEAVLTKAGMGKDEVDWLIPHQANLRIIQATAKRLDLPMERVVLTVQDHGNTSAASVPMALDVAVRDGRVQRGQVLLLEAFGGGLTWGSALLRY
jgi:3-oxoacyl-[acyl-carrier-protein] synthase-3